MRIVELGQHTFPDILKIHGMLYHDGYLWLSEDAGDNRLIKVDITDYSYEVVDFSGVDSFSDRFPRFIIYSSGYIWGALYLTNSKKQFYKIDVDTLEVTVFPNTPMNSEYQKYECAETDDEYIYYGGQYGIDNKPMVSKVKMSDTSNITHQTYAGTTNFHGSAIGAGYLYFTATPSLYKIKCDDITTSTIYTMDTNNIANLPSKFADITYVSNSYHDRHGFVEGKIFLATQSKFLPIAYLADSYPYCALTYFDIDSEEFYLIYIEALDTGETQAGWETQIFDGRVFAGFAGAPGYLFVCNTEGAKIGDITFDEGFDSPNEFAWKSNDEIWISGYHTSDPLTLKKIKIESIVKSETPLLQKKKKKLFYLDLSPTYIPFIIQCLNSGAKTNPDSINLYIYENIGTITSAFSSAFGEGFDRNLALAPTVFDSADYGAFDDAFDSSFGGGVRQINEKTGFYGIFVPKNLLSANKQYQAYWEYEIDGKSMGKQEIFNTYNSESFYG